MSDFSNIDDMWIDDLFDALKSDGDLADMTTPEPFGVTPGSPEEAEVEQTLVELRSLLLSIDVPEPSAELAEFLVDNPSDASGAEASLLSDDIDSLLTEVSVEMQIAEFDANEMLRQFATPGAVAEARRHGHFAWWGSLAAVAATFVLVIGALGAGITGSTLTGERTPIAAAESSADSSLDGATDGSDAASTADASAVTRVPETVSDASRTVGTVGQTPTDRTVLADDITAELTAELSAALAEVIPAASGNESSTSAAIADQPAPVQPVQQPAPVEAAPAATQQPVAEPVAPAVDTAPAAPQGEAEFTSLPTEAFDPSASFVPLEIPVEAAPAPQPVQQTQPVAVEPIAVVEAAPVAVEAAAVVEAAPVAVEAPVVVEAAPAAVEAPAVVEATPVEAAPVADAPAPVESAPIDPVIEESPDILSGSPLSKPGTDLPPEEPDPFDVPSDDGLYDLLGG